MKSCDEMSKRLQVALAASVPVTAKEESVTPSDTLAVLREARELWAPVVGWPHYEVSTLGQVRKAGGRPIAQWINSRGYVETGLCKPTKRMRVHRLVAEAFLPNPERKPSVNHIDCVPTNNCVTNLEWCTQAENIAHAARLGRMSNRRVRFRSHKASLSEDVVAAIRKEAGTMSLQKLADKWGTHKSTVLKIIHLRTYKPLTKDA